MDLGEELSFKIVEMNVIWCNVPGKIAEVEDLVSFGANAASSAGASVSETCKHYSQNLVLMGNPFHLPMLHHDQTRLPVIWRKRDLITSS